MTDYYRLLGVLPTATTEEIKKAYRQMALKYHPDRNNGDKDSEAYFKKVTEAYNILSNPEDRENYNWEYRKSQQTSTNQNQQGYRDQPKQEQKITPQEILSVFQDIRNKVVSIDRNRINQSSLYNSLNKLLSDNNINFLLSKGENKTNNQIISEVMLCCKVLAYPYVDKLSFKLAKLAGSDNDTIQKIYAFNRRQKYWSYWSRYRGIFIIAIIVLLLAILSNMIGHSLYPSYPSEPINRPSNGDLNNTFSDDNTTSVSPENNPSSVAPELTTEQLLQREKEKMLAEGWAETEINNGQLPSCYNFVPTKSDIDNYLEVQVGGGTDVAIKVMNLENEQCIRYVFVNSGSTFRIRNIPEGRFYLKIAYGKDWFSKVENGKCIGSFLRNPIYEKGEDIMDFNLQHTADGFNIPSFKLKLDVKATNTMNTFDAQNISENEFNQ